MKKIECQINSLLVYLNSTDKIAQHPFFPFLAFDIEERRSNEINKIRYYERKSKELTGESLENCKEILIKLQEKGIIKKRPIRYASHFDGYIYSYYAKLLSKKYEEKIDNLQLGDEILAYRKLPKVLIKGEKLVKITVQWL